MSALVGLNVSLRIKIGMKSWHWQEKYYDLHIGLFLLSEKMIHMMFVTKMVDKS